MLKNENLWQNINPFFLAPVILAACNSFISTPTGWFLLKTYDDQYVESSFRLLKTTDGGVTWTELSPVINP
ncbi:MAG TPA: hypothetical protein V6C97_15915 [Oculatellaceae cyanobacterium]